MKKGHVISNDIRISVLEMLKDVHSFSLIGRELKISEPTVRNIFNEKLEHLEGLSLEDGAATATAFAAEAISYSVSLFLPEAPKKIIVSGGGANNPTMIRFIRRRLPNIEIETAKEVGWNIEAIEAQAFGYLAVRSYFGLPITFPKTTGVREPLPGGELHQPHQG